MNGKNSVDYSPKIMHAQEGSRSEMSCFCGLPARTFETQEAERLLNCKKLNHEVENL